MTNVFLTSTSSDSKFVDLDVPGWAWVALLVFISVLLMFDILVIHRKAHDVVPRRALIESVAWISVGLAFTGVIAIAFGGAASGEYISGYLIEESLSVDNVFMWALILSFYKIPLKFQHRVLFWGIFGTLVLRAIFIFAGVALIERFTWVLYIFGSFLLYTAVKMVVKTEEEMDPASGRFMKLINRFVPSTPDFDEQKFFTRKNGVRFATPLFAVLILIEFTDVLFAVDSVPAVLAVSREQFLVFSSNAFAILGLRALYFILADAHARFRYLNEGLAVILAFVGIKMLIQKLYHIPTWLSLVVIVIVLVVAIGLSMKADRNKPTTSPMD